MSTRVSISSGAGAGAMPMVARAGSPAALRDRQGLFDSVLRGVREEPAAPGESPDEAMRRRVRASAEEFISMALVQPILKQAREANQAPPPFGPGEGERSFGHLADAQVARRIVRSARFGVVDAVERQLLARLSPAAGHAQEGVDA